MRPEEELPETLIAFTGALRLADDVEFTPFLVMPGPGAPYVLPRLLDQEGVRAVVSSVAIGAHQGYVIAYFAESPPDGAQRANDWGSEIYRLPDASGEDGWDTVIEVGDTYDFELGPWI